MLASLKFCVSGSREKLRYKLKLTIIEVMVGPNKAGCACLARVSFCVVVTFVPPVSIWSYVHSSHARTTSHSYNPDKYHDYDINISKFKPVTSTPNQSSKLISCKRIICYYTISLLCTNVKTTMPHIQCTSNSIFLNFS